MLYANKHRQSLRNTPRHPAEVPEESETYSKDYKERVYRLSGMTHRHLKKPQGTFFESHVRIALDHHPTDT